MPEIKTEIRQCHCGKKFTAWNLSSIRECPSCDTETRWNQLNAMSRFYEWITPRENFLEHNET